MAPRGNGDPAAAVEQAALQTLAQAAELDEPFRSILQNVCCAMDWRCGALWLIDEPAGEIRCAEFWAMDDSVEPFAERTRNASFPRGRGLPGRVWDTDVPAWIDDVVPDPNFPRAAYAAKVGLHAALATPIRAHGRTIGVLEFYSEKILEPDERLLDMLGVIGAQIGRFVDHQRTVEQLRASEARKTAILETALDAIITIDADGTIAEFNPAAERTFGFAAADVLGRRLGDVLVTDENRAFFGEWLAGVPEVDAAGVLGRRIEVPLLRGDGREIVCELAVTRVETPEGVFYTGIARDVTRERETQREAMFQKSLLEAEAEASIDGILVLGLDGKVLYANQRLSEVWGVPPFELDAPEESAYLTKMLDRLDPAGERSPLMPPDEDDPGPHRAELLLKDGRVLERWTALLRNGDDQPYARAWGFRDITDRKQTEDALRRSEERQRIRAAVSPALATAPDPRTALRLLTEICVPQLADWCAVHLVDERGRLEIVAVAHADASLAPLVRELQERYPPDPDAATGVAQVIRSGEPLLLTEIDEAAVAAAARDEEHLELLRGLGFRSAIIVPLARRGETIGAVSIISSGSGRRYGEAELRLLQDIAERASIHVETARILQERAEIARSLQQALLPPHLPRIPGVEIAARYHPAGEGLDVGGDFYDVFQTALGAWAVVVGDAAGKGAPAAAVTGLARFTVRAAKMSTSDPAEILAILNEALRTQTSEDMFCTAVMAMLERRRRGVRLTVSCGGHPMPYLLKAITRGGGVDPIECQGTMLGVLHDPDLSNVRIDLHPKDTLVLYTDGVTEARSGDDRFGEHRLAALLERFRGMDADYVADRINDAVLDFQSWGPRDDIAIVVIRVL